MRFAPGILATMVFLGSARSHARPYVARGPTSPNRLAPIDALIAAGCYDCLADALARARELVALSKSAEASARVRQAAGLLAIGERGLGLIDQHHLESAREADPDTPLLRFTAAICGGFEADTLAQLMNADSRSKEINYFVAIAATRTGNLDEADRRFQAAFDWRQDWPAVTNGVANLAMTAEDFDRATDFYGRTLALVPGNSDAMIGRVRSRSRRDEFR